MNKLAENALTAPTRTPFQQWLIDLALELIEANGRVVNERTVLLKIASIAASGDLPPNVNPSVRGIGHLANAVTSIMEYITANGWAL